MAINAVSKLGRLRARFNRSRGVAELAADIAFACMLLLALFALFMGWQAWLIARESGAAQSLAQEKTEALARVAAAISAQRQAVDRALANPGLRTALDGGGPAAREQAAQRLRALLPEAREITFYSASLDEVLKGNLPQLGYARAAQLLRAQGDDAAAPVEVRARPPQMISYVEPVTDAHGAVLAYAELDMPFTPVRSTFDTVEVDAGRLDLRQGDGTGDVVLASRGEEGISTSDDLGVPVPHSRLRIAAATPAYWLPLTHSLILAALLAGLALIAAIGLFAARARIRSRAGAVAEAEPSLAEITQSAPKTATPAPVAKPAAEPAGVPPHAVEVEPGIFRAYDIRGVVGQTLNEDTARAIGRAIGSAMREKNLSEIVIGRDG